VKPKRLSVGETLGGRYRIESLLGQGGMSYVYLAEDLKLKGKKWAVKECWRMDDEVESFLEEAEMLAQLKHPQMPQLVDYFTPDAEGYAYLIMDYIQGPTLQDLFEEKGRELSLQTVVRYALQLCELFHYLHSFRPKPIIYRDLKPSNIMIDENDQIRLIDFGVARHFTIGKDADTMQIGTIGFASPEQFVTAQTDPRSDLYNLGAVLFYLLSRGQYVYMSKLPLSAIRPELPAVLLDTVGLLLQEHPQHRCQSAMEVKIRLKVLSEADSDRSNRTMDIHTGLPNRLLVVGGLYPGVGSTFAAITIARVLNNLGIPHSVVEHPVNEPDLYMQLYGDQNAPKSYAFASDLIGIEDTVSNMVPWEDGYTSWVPVNPDGYKTKWGASETFKLLHAVKKPVVIWDVASNWLDPSVQELCHSSDAIITVLDASPGKLNRPSTRQKLQQLQAMQESGRAVSYVTNRTMPRGMRSEWLESLPQIPVCSLPDMPYEEIIVALWKGRCAQDHPDWLEKLQTACLPLLRTILPDETLRSHGVKPKRFLSFLSRS
jgi:serine/threonine protein kinase